MDASCAALIVDCHVHLNNYHEDRRQPTMENIRLLTEAMDRNGVYHAIVISSYRVTADRPSAPDIVAALGKSPRFSVVEGVWVAGETPVDWEGVAARLREGVTRGLKFYPGYEHAYPHDAAFGPALDLAAKYRVPVMIHTGDTYAPRAKLKFAHPIHVDEVAVDYPDVNFVVCHLGNPWFRDTAELIYKNANVYTDISGLVLEDFTAPLEKFLKEEVEELILYSGEPDKILYGSDWPLVRMGSYRRFVDSLDLDPDKRAMLMGGNASKLFRLNGDTDGPPHATHKRPPPSYQG